MRRKEFDPKKWLNAGKPLVNKPETHEKSTVYLTSTSVNDGLHAGNGQSTGIQDEVNNLLGKIEAIKMDLTNTYEAWVQVGFALSSEFGEDGRSLYHRFSQFHPGYNENECNKQFDNCLASNGQGITINTLFYLAIKAGVLIGKPKGKENKPLQPEMLPDKVFSNLPPILDQACKVATSKEERDLLLLGSLGTISSCLPNWSGIYSGRRVYPNLYLFVFAEASAGKGMLNYCRRIVYPVHKMLREETAELKRLYQQEKEAYASAKKVATIEPPVAPPQRLLFIPANNSATGAFQLLDDNNGQGLIFETEGDTLSNAFKTEYGNYSDGFRKAFHHEPATYYRRGGNELVEIEEPKLSTVLSGTPRQIANLIPDAENGLFSRFLFYNMPMNAQWKDVFAGNDSTGFEDYFNGVGTVFFKLYQTLHSSPATSFTLSSSQAGYFNQMFGSWSSEHSEKHGLVASIRRLGLSTFRMAMIFTALRTKWQGSPPSTVSCSDEDFYTVMAISETLLQHSIYAYHELMPKVNTNTAKGRKQQFFDRLPFEFSRPVYVEVANSLGIPTKTAERHIKEFTEKGMLLKPMHNQYAKAG